MVVMRDIAQRKKAEAELRSLRRRLVNVQEDERRHLSHELHDEIGQELTGLGYLVERMMRSAGPGEASTSAMAKETVDRLLEKVRDLSMNLRPAMLDDLGLIPTLAWLANRFSTNGVDVDFKHSGLDARFDPEVETVAFRVAQEALTNVARHANSGAALAVRFKNDAISLTVEDKGVGFDPETLPLYATAGLAGMRERVALIGGSLEIISSPGRGTRISAVLPAKTVEHAGVAAPR